MPILKKGTFVKKSIPENLRLEDEILYCTMTQEIFTEYDEFFDRIILCNSLVWACSATGRSGLTYKEALQSEENVRQQLKEFPDYLQKPVLFLVTMTHCKKINDVVDDVFSFSKDHYFVGETVEAYETSKVKKSYKVLKVLDAKKENIPSLEKENNENNNEVNKQHAQSEDKKVETKENERNEVMADKLKSNDNINGLRKSPRKLPQTASTPKNTTTPTTTEPQLSCYEYLLQEISSVITGVKIINGAKLNRRKGLYTKERCKTFIRAHCENKEGVWKVKEAGQQRYKLNSLSFSSFFPGDPPSFEVHKPPSSIIDLTSEDKKVKSDEAKMRALKNDLKHANKQDMQQLEGELKKMKEMAAEKKEARMKQMKSEQSMRQKEVRECLEWIRTRDDLLCDDLKDLPRSQPVECEGVSNSRFGDLVFVVEFIIKFKSLLSIHAPKSFNIDSFHQSLMEANPRGLYSSLLQSFVALLLNIHSQEISCYKIDFNKEEENASDENMFINTIKQSYIDYGTGLHKLLLDDFTVSEVVKNYLRGMQADETPSIKRILQSSCVFLLSPDDKLHLMHLLAHHLLGTSVVRDFLDESSERIKMLSRELKMHQLNVAKREKDEAQYWAKKKQEGSLKAFLQGDKEELADQDLKRKSNRRTEVVEKIPDEYFSQLPTNNLDWDKVAKNERDQLKAWEKRKEEELSEELANFSESRSLLVAYDRTHRRFWLFNCLPGVFVEDDDCRTGLKAASKLKLVPQSSNSRNLNTLKQFLKGQEKLDKKLIDVINSIQAGNTSSNILGSLSNDSVNNEVSSEHLPEQECAMISALEQLNTKCKVRWSFYHTSKHLRLLLGGLNMRGLREAVLFKELKALQPSIEKRLSDEKKVRNALKFISPAIRKEADNTPNTSLKEDKKEVKRVKEKNNVEEEKDIKEDNTTAQDFEAKETKPKQEEVTKGKEDPLESFFIESLLGLEDRIFSGSLGNIKAAKRDEWRKDVEDRNYTKLFSYLHKENGKTARTEVNDSKQEDLMMKGLSGALVCVEQMMDARFLHSTLGFNAKKVSKFVRAVVRGDVKEEEDVESDDEKSSTASTINGKEVQVTTNNNALKKNLFIEYWEVKVKSCQNISQLFIYMSVLDSNILWSKSALHACCRICRRQRNPELMLLCDMCDKGHHTFCLKPPVQNIPEGDWFCPWCKPSEIVSPASTRSKKQQEKEEEEEEEESEANEDSEQEEDGEEVITKNFYRKAKNSKTNGYSSGKNKKQKELKKNKNSAKKKDNKKKKRKNYYEDSDDEDDNFDDKTESEGDNGEENNGEEEDTNYKLRKRNSYEGECVKKPRSSVEGSEMKRTSRNSSNTTSPSPSLTTLTLSPLAVRLSIPQCKDIIDKIVSLEDSWPFLEPVSKKEVPDYLHIIKNPMDFSTVKKKLSQNAYPSASQVISDVMLIFDNCKCYNEPSTVFYKLADKLNKILEKEMKTAVADSEIKGQNETDESELSSSAESKKSSRSKLSNESDKLYPIFNSDSKDLKKKVKRKRVEDDSDDEEEEEVVKSSRKRVRCL